MAHCPVLPVLRLKARFRTALKSSTVWFPNSAITVAKTSRFARSKTKSVHPKITKRSGLGLLQYGILQVRD